MMEKIVPPNHCPSNEEEKARIRMRHREALGAGMANAEASAYANDPIAGLCLPATLRASLGLLPPSATGTDTAYPDPGHQPASLDISPPLAPQQELTTSIDITGLYYLDPEVLQAPLAQDFSEPSKEDEIARVRKRHREGLGTDTAHPEPGYQPPPHAPQQELSPSLDSAGRPEKKAGPLLYHPDGALSQTLPAQISRERTVSAPGRCTENKVERGRLPNGRWPAGVSGNPKGRKPKNNDFDGPNELEQALDQKIKITQGARKRVLTRRTALREQMINQAIKGDHRARRDLIACADKRGIDLFAGQHKAIREAIAAAARSSSDLTLSEEVLDRLSPGTLDELIRVANELEAEKKKKID